MASLLATIEHWDNTINLFEVSLILQVWILSGIRIVYRNNFYFFLFFLQWTTRDDVLSTLINNMEFEQNIELRHAYMSSLPQLITNIGCAKWCEALTRVLAEYCEHHTDLRTLKATLEVCCILKPMLEAT